MGLDDSTTENIATEAIEEDVSPARDSKARTASAAVFFNENKSIAGFGNSMRAVFTSVRELVENSLDAAEKRGVTPKINVNIRRLEKKELIELMGTNVIKTKDKRVEFIELSCKDNGVGVPRDLVPQLFGTVLAGTKYGAQQTRGRFGLGSKMVLLYAMSTLDLPIEITTRPEGEKATYRVKLFIDLEKNAPIIVSDEEFKEGDEEYFDDYGTKIKVSFTGSWNLAKLYVREYFRQLAIITPYADMIISLPSDEGEENRLVFRRVVDEIPKPPEVVKIHPWGTDISAFRREMSHSTEDNLIDFLVNNFMGVTETAAEAFFQEVEVDPKKAPKDLTSQEIRRIVHDGFNRALKESKTVKRKRDRLFKFDDPKGDALSPLGSDRLRRGLEKELNPEFVESITRPPRAYEGHPFIIEAAIGYGGGVNAAAQSKGGTVVDNRIIYRYANRIPLIFGAGSDLITNITNSINWSDYGLTRGSEPLAIAVSLVSTKIPFPETSKEYIDKVEEIGAEVRLTLMQLGRKLKTFLGRRRRRQRERRRKSRFERYAPGTVYNLLEILKKEELWDPATGIKPERIIAALASGKPRIDSSIVPLRDPVYQAPIWMQQKTQISLQNNGIYEVATFFRTPNYELSQIIGCTEQEVDEIKRRTIAELDKADEIPELDTEILLSADEERRFHRRDETEKLIELPRLYKACHRRWIRNAYDYMVSTPTQLNKVQGLAIKLIEAERVKVIKSLFEEIDDEELAEELTSLFDEGALLGDYEEEIDKFTQEDLPEEVTKVEEKPEEEKEVKKGKEDEKLSIQIEGLFPPIEEFYEFDVLKKRKVNSVLEFLLETTHPSSPVDEKVLAPLLIPAFKENLKLLVEGDKRYGEIKVDVSSQPWIDGYLRNAFKRRKISTVRDVIKSKNDVLLEIGELQRTLFNGLIETLLPEKSELKPEEYNGPHPQVKVTFLNLAGINSLEKLAATSSADLVEIPELVPFVELVIEESKDKIMEYLTINNQLGPLNLLKEITVKIEEEMDRLNISDSMQLLITPLSEFDESIQERIKQAKLSLGRNFDNFYKKHQSAFDSAGITVLEELVFNAEHFLNLDLPKSVEPEIEEAVEYIMLPVILISPNLIGSLDILIDAGINTVGKFLVWPPSSLARVLDMSEEWINLLRDSFHIDELKSIMKDYLSPLDEVSHILEPKELEFIKDLQIETIPEATHLKWGDRLPVSLKNWKTRDEINNALISSIEGIVKDVKGKTNKKYVKQALQDLYEEHITTLIQFARLPTSSITQRISTKRKREAIEQLSMDLESTEPEIIKKSSKYYKAAFTYYSIEKLKSPIVFLSEFNTYDIGLLNENGITSIHQLFTEDRDQLSTILGIDRKSLNKKLNKSKFIKQGTPLALADDRGNLSSIIQFEREGNTYFERDEINALAASGYSTVESLYYSSDHRTFDVHGLSWEVIRHFKKLMQSPLVLITWKKIIKQKVDKKDEELDESVLFRTGGSKTKEDKEEDDEDGEDEEEEFIEIEHYETFTSSELEKLTSANIRRVMDFITFSQEKIIDLLGWEKELAHKRQTSIILQEAGIELSDLDIFRQDHMSHLKELGLITIEDLYFTAKEETWESSIIPWKPIKTVKDILHLPLKHVAEEIGEDIMELLISNDITTILEFILTGDPILEQKTGLPAERFENLKYALDFGALIEAFDKTVFFTPGLPYYQAKTLHENGYGTILELILGDISKISKLLGLSKKEVRNLFDQIHRTEIVQAEEERGISVRQLKAFSRSDTRSIAKSGIFEMNEMDTLQEVLYQITPDIFQGENYLLEQVKNLQKVCQIELSRIGDLNEQDVQLLAKNNITTIADALLVEFEGEVDLKLNNALTTVSRSLLDILPFIAMGKIKSQAAMSEGEDTTPLLDKWLNDPEDLHRRTLRNIRSILSLPVNLTSFSKLYEGPLEELEGLTIADLAMEYIPGEDDPHYLLQKKINDTGSLIRLLREGSTPLTLVDLAPQEFRALIRDGINTIERVMMNDVRYLSELSGTTQKYWREFKKEFDPEIFKNKIEDEGIPISYLSLSKSDLEYMDRFGINYLDEITVYDQPKGSIKQIQDFLFAPTIFLIGTPGEKELAENRGAESIIEAVMALKHQSGIDEVLKDMFVLAWEAYLKNSILLPKKFQKNSLKTIQDLCSMMRFSPEKLTKKQKEFGTPFFKSPLLLPLEADDMERIIQEYRCSTVIDSLTSPLLTGKIDEIRESLKQNEPLQLLDEIDLPNILLKDISKNIWKRVEKSNLSLQEILSSPRGLDVYRDTKQKYLQEARQALTLPLTRIHVNGNQPLLQLSDDGKYLRLEDLLFDLPTLYQQNPDTVDAIKSTLSSHEIEVLGDIELPEEVKKGAETAYGVPIDGFHDLWATTWKGIKILTKIETKPSELLTNFIKNAFSDVSYIKDIKPIEVWHLWKLDVNTISDILLIPIDDLGSSEEFTKKRVGELKSAAVKTLHNEDFSSKNELKQFEKIIEIEPQDMTITIPQLFHPNPHPLFKEILEDLTFLKNILIRPILITKVRQNLSINNIQRIHGLGVYNLADLIMYPEEIKKLPKQFQSKSDRIELIANNHEVLMNDEPISSFNIPDILYKTYGKDIPLSKLLFNIQNTDDVAIEKALSIPLKYSGLKETEIGKLQKMDVFTIYDLLHVDNPTLSSIFEITEEKASELIKNLEVDDMFKRIKEAPLQVSKIDGISSGARSQLQENDIYTLLDLYLPLDENFNRIDTSYLTTMCHILDSDPSYLLAIGKEGRDIYNRALKNKHSTVREIILNRDDYIKSITKVLSVLSADALYSLQEKHRPLHDFELIIIKDEKNLVKEGYFTFIAISNLTESDLKKAGISKQKSQEIIDLLNSHWRNVIDLPESAIEFAQNNDISNVAELLSAPELLSVELSKPIKVKMELKIDRLFDEVPKSIESAGVSTVPEFIRSDKMVELFKQEDPDVINIFSVLNSWIGNIPKIDTKWVPKLETNKIFRIYQYIMKDTGSLAGYCGTSIKAQEQFKEKMKLHSLLKSRKFTIPTASKKDQKIFEKYGIFTLKDLNVDGMLDPFISNSTALQKKIKSYRKAMDIPIYKLQSYWEKDTQNRRDIAINAVTVREVGKYNDKISEEFISDAIKEKFREEKPLSDWISNKGELAKLNDMGIESVEAWMFFNIRGDIEPGSPSFVLFRSTLDAIPYFEIKHIVSGFHNGMTHISDMLMEDNKELAKKLRTTTKKVEELLESIPDLTDDRPTLPNIGLVSSSIVDSMREGGIYSWAQILGNAIKEEIELIKGVTWNTVQSAREYANVPLWYSLDIRALGVSNIRKLTNDGVRTIADILVIGQKFEEFLGDKEKYIKIMENISRANLNKGKERAILRLSASHKIRVKDIPKYEKEDIESPLDIILGCYDVDEDSPLMDGIEDWRRLGELKIEEINFPKNVIKSFKKAGIKLVEDALVAPDSYMRELGATTHQIKLFRKDLNRLKRGEKRIGSK